MTIYLIRHGQTRDNASRVVQQPDAELSETGLAQAQSLADRLREQHTVRPMSLILCSDHRRALQTAEPVASELGLVVSQRAMLRERSFGQLRGRSYASIGVDFMARDFVPPGGESWSRFEARIQRAWWMIQAEAADTHGDTLVITHGLVCRGLAHLVAENTSPLPNTWSNTSVTEVFDPFLPRLGAVNCTKHLKETISGGAV